MVSVTKAEYEAIMFCREQVTGAIEGASDENYVKEASEAIEGIVSFRKKYLKAVAKQNRLAMAKQAVKKLHPEIKGKRLLAMKISNWETIPYRTSMSKR